MIYACFLTFILLTTGWLSAFGQENRQTSDSRAQLEQQLWQIEQQWLAAEHDQKGDFLRDLLTDQFFDIFPGGSYVTKQELLQLVTKSNPKPGTGAFPDDFSLRAVYDNVALATDHTTLKGVGPISGEYRVLRMFVKEKGKWKVAGAALVQIATP
jgi:hypothetical protein